MLADFLPVTGVAIGYRHIPATLLDKIWRYVTYDSIAKLYVT